MFQIRPANFQDCPGLAQVQVDSYRTAYASFFPSSYFEQMTYAEQEQDWREWLASGKDEILLVAHLAETQVVGYVLAKAEPDVYPGYASEIMALHVRRAHQHQGLGYALLQSAARQLAECSCQSVMLWTLKGNPIRRWYEKLGGQFLGEKTYPVDDWDIVEVAYGWKPLTVLLP